jgi:hypothetical protein
MLSYISDRRLSVVKYPLLAAFLILMAMESRAGLIGSETRVDHVYHLPMPWAQPTATGVVVEGPSDTINLEVGLTASGAFGYEIDLNEGSLYINFYLPEPETYWLYTGTSDLPIEPSDFPYKWFNGLLITNPELDINVFLDTFVIESQVGLIDYFYKYDFLRERIYRFDDRSLALDFQGLRFSDTSELRISFSQPIPLPSTIALVVVALFIRYFAMKKLFFPG